MVWGLGMCQDCGGVCVGVEGGEGVCRKLHRRVCVTACQRRAPVSARVQAQVALVSPSASTVCVPPSRLLGLPRAIARFSKHLAVVGRETLLRLGLSLWQDSGDQTINHASVPWGAMFDKKTGHYVSLTSKAPLLSCRRVCSSCSNYYM